MTTFHHVAARKPRAICLPWPGIRHAEERRGEEREREATHLGVDVAVDDHGECVVHGVPHTYPVGCEFQHNLICKGHENRTMIGSPNTHNQICIVLAFVVVSMAEPRCKSLNSNWENTVALEKTGNNC